MERTIVGIDVGTTKVCTLVGEADEEGLCVVGVGISPSRGLREGVVVDVNDATEAIHESVEEAERTSGYRIKRAYVGIAGAHISSTNSRGMAVVSRRDRSITQGDINRALKAAQAIAIPYNRQVIHAIPRSYTIDGQEGVRDPLGLYGFRLEVEVHIITGAITFIQNLIKCVRELNIEVEELVFSALASSEAVLTDAERDMGVALIDIGGGTTGVVIFAEGSIWHSAVLKVGGSDFTNDVAICLRAPFYTADEAKKRYGHAIPSEVPPEETIEIAVFGSESKRTFSRRLLSQIIEARAEQIFGLILKEIKHWGYDGLLPAGVVLCGGTAELAGIREFGQEILQLPVRIGSPYDIHGLVDSISGPAYAASVGLLLWGLRYGTVHPAKETLLHRLIRWFKEVFYTE